MRIKISLSRYDPLASGRTEARGMTQASGSARYEGMLSTVRGATYGAAMALVGVGNLSTHFEQILRVRNGRFGCFLKER